MIKRKGEKVAKGLNDEEKTILANIKSLVSQLESMEAAEGAGEGETQDDETMNKTEEGVDDEG